MSGFSAAWLALREAADHRSRDTSLADQLAARLGQRDSITVLDLGCGTGSNLRATSSLLGPDQRWTLVDYDPALLAAAAEKLAAWADSVSRDGDALICQRGGKTIRVVFRQADLTRDLVSVLDPAPDLVTASALFDLCSKDFIVRFANAVAQTRAAFYTVLTYNGVQRWTPRHPLDQSMTAAFNAHQMTDKGFGLSAGPTAPAHLADAFQMAGYDVQEGDSPWLLKGAGDAALVTELATGFGGAVAETGKVAAKDLDAWRKITRTGAEVGHTDTLAFPGRPPRDDEDDDQD